MYKHVLTFCNGRGQLLPVENGHDHSEKFVSVEPGHLLPFEMGTDIFLLFQMGTDISLTFTNGQGHAHFVYILEWARTFF